ncbi:MAG: hypothetical protein ACR2P6_10110 [Gammaproteobacteria bacterium]
MISRPTQLVAIWMLASLVAILVAFNFTSAALVEGEWTPVGNDSFYHARRILDATEGERGFYEFDDTIHVPEGSWITWPWAYDYLMAKALQGAKVLDSKVDPMRFMSLVPVYWVVLNAALLILIAIALRLPTELIAVAMLGFALSPLTQFLHGVGVIDHHYVEYTFALLAVLSGLLWLQKSDHLPRAAAVGAILGIAPAFHNGMFALQIPLMSCLVILWLKHSLPPARSLQVLAVALLAGTLVAVLPSEPFWDGQFQFSTLSWFHLYIATASAVVTVALAQWRYSAKSSVGLAAVCIALLIPISYQMLGGAAFLSKDIVLLENVSETKSMYEMFVAPAGWRQTAYYYSMFGWFAPLLLIFYTPRLIKEQSPAMIFFCTSTVFGICLLLVQFRLHYFGSFALIIGWLVLAHEQAQQRHIARSSVFAAALVALGVAYYLPIRTQLFYDYPAGMDRRYELVRPLLVDLGKVCELEPGIALANNNDGHYVRFHTDCSVIANNFIMTPQHEEKIYELYSYMDMTPEQLLEADTDIRYIFVQLGHLYKVDDDGETVPTTLKEIFNGNSLLFSMLALRSDLPPRYRIWNEMRLTGEERNVVHARILEILPEEDIAAETGIKSGRESG